MITIRYNDPAVLNRAVSSLRCMTDADFDAGLHYVCVNQQQLEELAALNLVPPLELLRLRNQGTLPPLNGDGQP